MNLNDIVLNSNYITDEEIEDANILGIANLAISEINSKISTNLPFFKSENISTNPYIAITPSWCLRLIEPYISYSISANDGDDAKRDFHYNRFISAVLEFKQNGLKDILAIDPDTGEETGFAGSYKRMAKINPSDVTMYWKGWL